MDGLRIDSACIVGHAMGGAVAQALACGWPERVTRVCLVNSVAFDAWPRRAARLARWLCASEAMGRRIGAPLLASLVHGSLLTGYTDAEVGRRSLDSFLHAFTSRLGADTLVAQLRAMRDPTVESLGDRLGTFGKPTAIVWGELDPIIGLSVGERLRDAIPGATLEVIEGGRHFTPVETPERIAKVVGELLGRRS